MLEAPKPKPSGGAALEKGLALFNLIAGDRGQTPLKALAADLNLPRATLYRLAGALARAGLIARLEPQHYDIGLPLAATLNGMSAASQLARLCRPALRQLGRRCGATAHLGLLENDMVTYLVKENAAAIPQKTSITREATQLEAYGSGIGKVLLAWLPEAERARYLAAGPFVALTQRTTTDPAALRDLLKRVRIEQFARDDGEIVDDIYCLAVPVWTMRGAVGAAISLSFVRHHKQRRDDAFYVAKLRECSAKLGRALCKSSLL